MDNGTGTCVKEFINIWRKVTKPCQKRGKENWVSEGQLKRILC